MTVKSIKKTLNLGDAKVSEFQRRYLKEGDYAAKIINAEEKESSKGNDMVVYTISVAGATFPFFCMLDPERLGTLRQVWEACGLPVKGRSASYDLSKPVGSKITVSVIDDGEYNGRPQSRIFRVAKYDPSLEDGPVNDEDDLDEEQSMFDDEGDEEFDLDEEETVVDSEEEDDSDDDEEEFDFDDDEEEDEPEPVKPKTRRRTRN